MKTGKIIFLLIAFIVSASVASQSSLARQGSMTLLAVSETLEGYEGSIADLYLEIRPGSGNVFVDTFPVTKIDTQISMRFAKQIACKRLDAECGRHDFVYTIRASSGIVGGPSAGAAAAVLTLSLLEGTGLKDSTAITGTINSGGIIGPVGGLKEKIDVAAENGFSKVLVPAGEDIELGEMDNQTVNISEYSQMKGIEIVEISSLDTAFLEFTGKKLEKKDVVLEISPEYEEVMKQIADSMCARSDELESSYLDTKPSMNIDGDILEKEESAIEAKEKGKELAEIGDYYSGASRCFSSSIRFRDLIYYIINISSEEKDAKRKNLVNALETLEEEIGKKEMKTISDLQTYMIVKDRILDAGKAVETSEKNISASLQNYWMAYAEERYFSILNWLKFFDKGRKKYNLENENLQQACMTKLSEANERLQYVRYYFPAMLADTEEMIDSAQQDMSSADYVMCIYKASKAKAESNIVLSMIGVEKDNTKNILSQKIEAAEQSIAEQQHKGIFPIMAYSYYLYSKTLMADDDTSSALLYAEYALELSNFDIYFEESRGLGIIDYCSSRALVSFAIGVLIGVLIGILAAKAIISLHHKMLLAQARKKSEKRARKPNKKSRKRTKK